MQNHSVGTLLIYLDEEDPNLKAIYELAEGENFVGGSLFCDVKLPYANIADLHCKITLTSQGDSSIEDLSNTSFGIYRATPKNFRQKLKSNKEYELLPDRPFYLTNKYKCLYRPKAYPRLARSSSSLPAHDQEEEEILQSRNIPARELVGSTGKTMAEEPIKTDKPAPIQRGKRYLKQAQGKQDVIVIKDTEESEETKMEIEKTSKKESGPVEPVKSEQPVQKEIKTKKVEEKDTPKKETPVKEVPVKEVKKIEENKPEVKEKPEKSEKQVVEKVQHPVKEKVEVKASPIKEKVEIKSSKEIPVKESKNLLSVEVPTPIERKDRTKSEDKTEKIIKKKSEPPPQIIEEERAIRKKSEAPPPSQMVDEDKPERMIRKKSEAPPPPPQNIEEDRAIRKKSEAPPPPSQMVDEDKTERMIRKKSEAPPPLIIPEEKTEKMIRKKSEPQFVDDGKIIRRKSDVPPPPPQNVEEDRVIRKKSEAPPPSQIIDEDKTERMIRKKSEAPPAHIVDDERIIRKKSEPPPPPQIEKKELKELEIPKKQHEQEIIKKPESIPPPPPEDDHRRRTEEKSREMEIEKPERKDRGHTTEIDIKKPKDQRDSVDDLNFEEDSAIDEEHLTREGDRTPGEEFNKGTIEPIVSKKPPLPDEPKKEAEYDSMLPRYGERDNKYRPMSKEHERRAERGKEYERKKDDYESRNRPFREKDEKEYSKYDNRREKGELDIRRPTREENDELDYKINRQRKDEKDPRRERDEREREQRPKEDKYLERKPSNPEDSNRYGKLPNYTRPYEPHGASGPSGHHNKLSIIKPNQIPPEMKTDRPVRDNKPLHKQWSNEKFEEDRKDRDQKTTQQQQPLHFPQYPQYPQYPQPQPPPPQPRKNEREPFRDNEKGSKGKDDMRYDRDFEGYRKKSFNEPRDLYIDKSKNKPPLKIDNKGPDRSASKPSFEEGESKPYDDPYGDKRRGTTPKSREKESLADIEKATTIAKKQKLNNEGKPLESEGELSGKGSTTRNNVSSEKEEAGEFIPERDQRTRPYYQVMFSGFDRDDREVEDSKRRLAQLGVRIVEERDKNFNVLVIKKFKRTIKFLLALNKGVDIVFFDWVRQCNKEEKVLSPGDFICSDREAETKYKFRLISSLQKARKKSFGFLKGYKVFFPTDINPSLDEMRLLVESADGVWLKARPQQPRDDILVILNVGDRRASSHFKDSGFTPHSSELIFSGILRQELNLTEHRM